MLKKSYLLMSSCVFLLLMQVGHVQASLLIAPTRVTINDRQRSDELILVNKGSKTQTYRLLWEEKALDQNGNLKKLSKEESKNYPIASPMIRYSPKQVTLKPGARQVVKISVRRPKNLKDGEYRSYLVLSALPVRRKNTDAQLSDMAMSVKLKLSYSLPVVIRKGVMLQPEVSIADVSLHYKGVKTDSYVEKQKIDVDVLVQLARSGLYYSNGNLIVRWQGEKEQEEKIVDRIHDVILYPDAAQQKSVLKWDNAIKEAGTLRVTLEGIKSERGKILAEKVIAVTPAMFKKIKE